MRAHARVRPAAPPGVPACPTAGPGTQASWAHGWRSSTQSSRQGPRLRLQAFRPPLRALQQAIEGACACGQQLSSTTPLGFRERMTEHMQASQPQGPCAAHCQVRGLAHTPSLRPRPGPPCARWLAVGGLDVDGTASAPFGAPICTIIHPPTTRRPGWRRCPPAPPSRTG